MGFRIADIVQRNGDPDWESGESAEYHTRYDQALKDGVEILKDVRFGGTDDERRYDKQFWKLGRDRDGDEILVMKAGKKPSDAVGALFDKPTEWSLDCIEYVQALRWYAQLRAKGAERFDREIKSTVFKLSYHETTGLRSRQLYQRDRKRDQFDYVDGLTNRRIATDVSLTTAAQEDVFLAKIPVGSRVMWSDAHPDARDTDFENENTIKVGDDSYAAHPFGVLPAAELRQEMGPTPYDEPKASRRQAYIRRWIFIKEIEWYART